jgi:hypothetical protein
VPLTIRAIDLCDTDEQALRLFGHQIVELVEDRVPSSTQLIWQQLATSRRGRLIRDYVTSWNPDSDRWPGAD